MSKPDIELEGRGLSLPRRFLRACRRSWSRSKVADSMGQNMTGGELLIRTLVLRRLLARLLARDERYVGLLLPPSAASVLANAALPLMNRLPVNLNYTVSNEVMNNCIHQCKIRHVLTSRRVMEKFPLELDVELVYLEELVKQVTLVDKIIAAAMAKLLPMPLLERALGVQNIQPDDLLTVIFTSGSTGEPKGVMLTQANIASQIESIDRALQLKPDEVALGILPFFHLYGYTATMWTVLTLDMKGVYHFNPLDPHQIGKLCREHHGTVLLATPTFLRTYLRRCEPEDLKSLEVVFGAAEKLPKELSDAFETKFGVRPLEAYGCTELSPLVAVNVPPSRNRSGDEGAREGTVGRPIPGVLAKVVDLDSGEPLPAGSTGMLLVGGPNVMKGYLDKPELTKQVLRDGWYVTGDVAKIDAEGFIHITGRQSRFSKIGGEMVPHLKIEEILSKAIGADEDQVRVVVTAVPDARKGERLIVFYTDEGLKPDELNRKLADAGLPNLWIPAVDSYCHVDEIPVLGTGKLDLKGLKDLALERFGSGKSD